MFPVIEYIKATNPGRTPESKLIHLLTVKRQLDVLLEEQFANLQELETKEAMDAGGSWDNPPKDIIEDFRRRIRRVKDQYRDPPRSYLDYNSGLW